MKDYSFNIRIGDELKPIVDKILENQNEIIERINQQPPVRKDTITNNKMYKTKDIKEIFGWNYNTILKKRNKGVLPYISIDNEYFYLQKDIDELIKKNKHVVD